MSRVFLLAPLLLAAFALPATAQEHTNHQPPPPSPLSTGQPQTQTPKPTTVAAPQQADSGLTGADLPIGAAEPPPVATDYASDRVWGFDVMAPSRNVLDSEHGGGTVSMIFARNLEYQTHDSEDGYRWNAEAWHGGDTHRLVLKAEGEGVIDGDLDSGEAQALYSRAIGPYTDLQVGVRQDIEPRSRTYAAVGFEMLAPYWFDLGGALFISDQGRILARLEGEYDLRLTQRLILEPRVELNFAATDDPAMGLGSGLANGEAGLRLRYEILREFAPYVGVVHERKFGGTADLARAAGEDAGRTSVVLGLRAFY